MSIEWSLDSAVKLNKTRHSRLMRIRRDPHLTGKPIAARHVVAMLGAGAIVTGHDLTKGLPMRVRVRRRRHASRVMSSALILALGAGTERAYASGADAAQPPKGSQTAAQQKISSRLLREIDRARRGAEKTQSAATPGVAIDSKGRALVEIRCDVTAAIQKKLRTLNATIVSSLPDYRSILAWVPLARLEELAGSETVYGIQPAPEATTNRGKR
jgi:hypothetical protein